jgi:competence protein ComGF
MNKVAFTLVEVLVSITLLSIVISTIFKIKENNIFLLEKFKNSSKQNELISIATIDNVNSKKLRNKNIYLSILINFKDDYIRKELKNVKITVKDKVLETQDLGTEDFELTLHTIKSTYSIENKASSSIYNFKLEY